MNKFLHMTAMWTTWKWYQHDQLNSVTQIKERKLNRTSRKNMSEKQLSTSTLLFRQGAMSWTFPSMTENYTTHLEHVHRFSLQTDRRGDSAGNGGDGLERLNGTSQDQCRSKHCTCCVSSNTPLRLSSSGTPFHRQLFLFFSFLCLVQPQTSLNNMPWLYFTAEHILRFCTVTC